MNPAIEGMAVRWALRHWSAFCLGADGERALGATAAAVVARPPRDRHPTTADAQKVALPLKADTKFTRAAQETITPLWMQAPGHEKRQVWRGFVLLGGLAASHDVGKYFRRR